MLNWQLLDYCRNPRLVQDIYTKLNSLDEGKLGEITRFLPKLIEVFTETLHEGDYVEICPIYEIFLSIYYLKESLTLDELKNIHTMTNCVLTSKYNRQKSEKFIEEVYDIFEKNISLEYLSWSIDITELVTFKTDGGELSVRFLSKILDKCNTPIIKNRISLIQTELIRSLCIDYNIQEDVLSGFKNTDNEIAVDDHSLPKFICIYTLDDNAGRRAQRLLIKKFPKFRIEINSDHTCTPSLKNLARKAELFIFCDRKAKHMAFDCVKNNRSEEIYYPNGKGSTSILEKVYESLQIGNEVH